MVEFFRRMAEALLDRPVDGISDAVLVSLGIVAMLLAVVSIFALCVSIYLAIKYHKYNKIKNSIGLTGENIARKLLDDNGLQNIAVKSSGSILFGNSYSHYFKKVRLRRLTWKKDSVSSLAMASQKTALAVLDKEGDEDMKKRVKLTPIIYVGPFLFIPLILVGVALDLFIIKSGAATCTLVLTAIGFAFYVLSFVMSILVLKTEIKAQKRAYEILKDKKMATTEELAMLEELFKLYNIEYVNDMIIALLEMIYRALQIIAYAQGNGSSKD